MNAERVLNYLTAVATFNRIHDEVDLCPQVGPDGRIERTQISFDWQKRLECAGDRAETARLELTLEEWRMLIAARFGVILR